MIIDTTFNVYSDAKGGDPDSTSPTLRKYHRLLWSKSLPNGKVFDLQVNKNGSYLWHSSSLGNFSLGSDAITHSYKNHKRKKWLTSQIPEEVNELFNMGSTIGAFLVFPNNKVDGKHTINQARGVNRLIDDRFDLTLECIKRFYLGQSSPLDETLNRYRDFFLLFENFKGYINFFFLNDLIDEDGRIKFYLPFDDFNSQPKFTSVDEYLLYKERVLQFIESRNRKIDEYNKELKTQKSSSINKS